MTRVSTDTIIILDKISTNVAASVLLATTAMAASLSIGLMAIIPMFSGSANFKMAAGEQANPIIISGISSLVSTSTSMIGWTTNVFSDSLVKYDEIHINPPTSTNKIVVDKTLVLSHLITLSGLKPSTTYYYMVQSGDDKGNVATSSEQFFSTLADAANDSVPPVISNINVLASSTYAIITWYTDEQSTSAVTYATSTFKIAAIKFKESDAKMVTAHEIKLNGLSDNSTYYFMVESSDKTNNTATSTEMTFKTLGLPPVIKFIRGDANQDGRVDYNDSDFILKYLFYGGKKPLCLDAADANDSGRVDISDPIFINDHLRAPMTISIKKPFPCAGTDQTPDNLGCNFYQTFYCCADTIRQCK